MFTNRPALWWIYETIFILKCLSSPVFWAVTRRDNILSTILSRYHDFHSFPLPAHRADVERSQHPSTIAANSSSEKLSIDSVS